MRELNIISTFSLTLQPFFPAEGPHLSWKYCKPAFWRPACDFDDLFDVCFCFPGMSLRVTQGISQAFKCFEMLTAADGEPEECCASNRRDRSWFHHSGFERTKTCVTSNSQQHQQLSKGEGICRWYAEEEVKVNKDTLTEVSTDGDPRLRQCWECLTPLFR